MYHDRPVDGRVCAVPTRPSEARLVLRGHLSRPAGRRTSLRGANSSFRGSAGTPWSCITTGRSMDESARCQLVLPRLGWSSVVIYHDRPVEGRVYAVLTRPSEARLVLRGHLSRPAGRWTSLRGANSSFRGSAGPPWSFITTGRSKDESTRC